MSSQPLIVPTRVKEPSLGWKDMKGHLSRPQKQLYNGAVGPRPMKGNPYNHGAQHDDIHLAIAGRCHAICRYPNAKRYTLEPRWVTCCHCRALKLMQPLLPSVAATLRKGAPPNPDVGIKPKAMTRPEAGQ